MYLCAVNNMVVYNYNGMKNDGLILRQDTTLLWQFDGGYVDLDANGTPTSWNYYVTDHLGSTRMIVDSNDSIKEVINYYPFGSEMRMELPAQMTSDPSHPFRFTGKELDKQNGLNMYDFGARLYDVAGVPMWTSVDPLAEKNPNMTPYHYCHNDPVNLIDPDGRDDYEINEDGYVKNVTSWIDKAKNFFGIGSKDDKIFMKGEKEPLVTLSEGSVANVKDGTDYSKLEIKDAKNAETTFQKIISKSNVEWAHIRHKDKGGSESSLIINNHSDTDVSKSAEFANMYKNNGEKIKLFEHSHPVPQDLKYGTNLSFSINVSGSNGMSGDIQTAKNYPHTTFRVFDLHQNRIQYYNGNGVYKTVPWKKR